MENNKIAESFRRAKQDILNLQSQITTIKQDILEIKRTLEQQNNQTHPLKNQTYTKEIQTDKPPLEPLSIGNKGVSTGNKGVQTDRQTIRQTDRHIQKFAQIPQIQYSKQSQNKTIDQLEKLSKTLDSLDVLKKDLRAQFKKLTPQEMLIFSTIYQLEEQSMIPDYALISQSTGLSESSIRDHVKNLINKGIPVDKTKNNNKKVTLSISPNLKKIASLDTILTLREL